MQARSRSFHLNGQITVKANAELDHETKPTHTVTVTATDPHNASDTITVTIHVTDVDEAPVIMVDSTENQAPRFPTASTTRSIPEGQSSGRAIGSRVTATDPNPNDSLTYSLEGTDAASFSIDSRDWTATDQCVLRLQYQEHLHGNRQGYRQGRIVRHHQGNHNRHRGWGADG